MSTPTDVLPDKPTALLTLADRCDRCGAQAFVRVEILTPTGLLPLLFCGHHYKANAAKLDAIAADVHNELDRINEKPDASA